MSRNVAAMELLRWLLLDKLRPQLAFCILQLKLNSSHIDGTRRRLRRSLVRQVHDAAVVGVAVGEAGGQGHPKVT